MPLGSIWESVTPIYMDNNSFLTEVLIIKKQVHWFAFSINVPVSI